MFQHALLSLTVNISCQTIIIINLAPLFSSQLAGIKLPDQNAADQLNLSLLYVPKVNEVNAGPK